MLKQRLLSHAIHTHVLDPALLPPLLRTVRAALFPKNAPAPTRIPPSAAEALAIRRKCAEVILTLIPGGLQEVYFGSKTNTNVNTGTGTGTGTVGKDFHSQQERRIREVEEVLDVFGDEYCNRHFMYGVVELVLVRLMPELAEKGVMELCEERLG